MSETAKQLRIIPWEMGPKLKRDWVGLRVCVLCELQNFYGVIPAATYGTITDHSPGHRQYTFTADACRHCGIQLKMSGLQRRDFAIVTPPEDWPDTRGKGRRR